MQIVKGLFASLLLSITFFNSAYAQTGNVRMSDGEIFTRCYMKLFKTVVPRTNSLGKTLMDNVLQKKISGPAACVVLLNQSEFVDNGQVRKAKSTSYPKLTESENQNLIQNLHNFHTNWFSKKSLEFAGTALDQATYVIRDMDEPSLYLTRALFSNNVRLDTIFTANKSMRGVRVTPDKSATTRWQSKPMNVVNESFYSGTHPGIFLLSYGNSVNLDVLSSIPMADSKLVPFGKLIGVEDTGSLNVPLITITTAAMANSKHQTDLQAAIGQRRRNVDLFEHLGGGILGSQTFIMKNTNLTLNQTAPGRANDPDQVIARRLSSRVFEDLLCHQMPTLRESDVVNDVRKDSPHGFRLHTSCMSCHTSLDPMATVFRNFASYRTSPNNNINQTVADREAKLARGTPVVGFTRLPANTSSDVFTLKAPSGGLNYRDHTDRLIKVPVTGTEQLGKELAKSDDFYRCVTKRYYEYFTGFKVNLAPRNVAADTDTAEAQFHRAKVYSIANRLKTSQSLMKMIQDIVSSEGFTYRHYEVAGP